MLKEDLQKDWRKWLIDLGKSETELAKENNIFPQNLNRKINSGSIKYLELASILEHYGYTLKIVKEG